MACYWILPIPFYLIFAAKVPHKWAILKLQQYMYEKVAVCLELGVSIAPTQSVAELLHELIVVWTAQTGAFGQSVMYLRLIVCSYKP